MKAEEMIVVQADTLLWEESSDIEVGLAKYRTLHKDLETGIEVRIIRYPAGVKTPRHAHLSAEGMYVLEGTLVTWAGSYGPGSFVWFPEGTVMEHGASKDHGVTVLSISDKALKTYFVYH